MKAPHKHAEVIKAWAMGASIEYRKPGCTKWRREPDCDAPGVVAPTFEDRYEYRIKPEPRKGWYRVGLLENKHGFVWAESISYEAAELTLERRQEFIRWLTPRTEYEVD